MKLKNVYYFILVLAIFLFLWSRYSKNKNNDKLLNRANTLIELTADTQKSRLELYGDIKILISNLRVSSNKLESQKIFLESWKKISIENKILEGRYNEMVENGITFFDDLLDKSESINNEYIREDVVLNVVKRKENYFLLLDNIRDHFIKHAVLMSDLEDRARSIEINIALNRLDPMVSEVATLSSKVKDILVLMENLLTKHEEIVKRQIFLN